MLFLMLAAVLFAAFIGALAFVTGPVGLAMAAGIAAWLLLYAARAARSALLRSKSEDHAAAEGRSAAGSTAGSTAEPARRSDSGAVHHA